MLYFMESCWRERRTDLMSLLTAEQIEVLQLSVQLLVNLENQESLCPASQGFVAAQMQPKKRW